jgi:NADPH:quinone reductase-like Zn-dependent oxidoreductase
MMAAGRGRGVAESPARAWRRAQPGTRSWQAVVQAATATAWVGIGANVEGSPFHPVRGPRGHRDRGSPRSASGSRRGPDCGAAALPAAIETATRALDQLGVASGCTLLINGASGSVGSTAVQLAVVRGARVIGTASRARHEYLCSLGAEPVAYGEGLVMRVRALTPDGVDAAFDVAGSGILPELIQLASGQGHVLTIADFGGAQEHGVTFSSGDAGRAVHALAEIGELIEPGRFSLPVARTFPLADVAEAHRVSEAGHVRGKLVLVVGSPLCGSS